MACISSFWVFDVVSRPAFSLERRKKEGKFIEEKFSLTKKGAPRITKAGLLADMKLSPGMWRQWSTGQTRIADEHLIYLSKRLGFDAISVRPELAKYQVSPYAREDGELLKKLNKMTVLQRNIIYEIVDIIAKLGV